MHVTNHAVQRWVERFNLRIVSDIRDEFKRSDKCKPNRLRKLGIRIDPKRRYYITDLCVFVVDPHTNTIITILQRKR